ncbi:cobalamin-binding protein [Candidatus Saganbacteria bacterium]|nr:cobalamin-binding protein [Candidatus Saganbacteria bacterium]
MLNKLSIIVFIVLLATSVWAEPQRIISTIPCITETLFALGLEDKIVGVTENCNYPAGAKQKEKVGREIVNTEKVIALKPDLVLMLEDAQRPDIEKLKKFKLPVVTVNPHNVDEVLDTIKRIGEITGTKERAEEIVFDIQARLNEVKRKASGHSRPKVFLVVGYRPLITTGPGTFVGNILKLSGGDNIVLNSRSPYPEWSFETLIEADPEVIVIMDGVVEQREVLSDKRWAGLSAVRNNRIVFIDPDIISRPGPRVIKAIELLAELF